VLGIESVPDGLASGLLAGVNPVAGLYGYLYGMIGGALFTSTTFMTIQATGAMAIVINDVDLASRDDPTRSLITLSILTGVVMILAGLLRLGSFLRLVSMEVMTGFITAVGINIVLGQLDDFTGYEAEGGNRVIRAFDLLFNFWEVDIPTVTVGAVTIALIVVLRRTRLGPLGLVVAIILGSALAGLFNALDWEIAQVGDIADIPRSLPFLKLPIIGEIPSLLLPAASLAFVGLVQGAGVSAGFPNEDGTPSDESQDFIGQGAGNITSGLFQGMPVGGSMSASSLVATAGAKTRFAVFVAGAVMAVIILLFAGVVELVAMPSLAGLLIIVGIGTIKPEQVKSVAKTGPFAATVMVITLILTMIIPLQFAVLVGVGLSVIIFVARQSMGLVTKRMYFHDDGRVEEVDLPETIPPNEVIVLQPYGAVFFATAPALLDQMPDVTPESRNSVVILRVRGADDAGATLLDVLEGYASSLKEVDSKLVVVTDNARVIRQLRVTGVLETMGEANVYEGTAFLGETTRVAHDDAVAWVEHNRAAEPPDDADS
jgi:SulP family sulfate permease